MEVMEVMEVMKGKEKEEEGKEERSQDCIAAHSTTHCSATTLKSPHLFYLAH